MKTLITFLGILFVFSVSLNAQNKKGKIKVHKAWVKLMDGTKTKGVLYAADSTGVTISNSIPTNYLNTIGVNDIEEIRIRKKRNVGKGVWIGALSGATLGAISGLASGDDNSGGWFSYTKEEKAIGTGVFLGIVGVGVGALAGTYKKKIVVNGNAATYKNYLGLIQSYALVFE